VRHLAVAAGLLLSIVGASATALEISGVELADSLNAGDKTKLILNGAGIRSKFIFDIYVGALYLPRPATSAAKILAMAGAKRVEMHILYSEISAKKLRGGWSEGFEANQDEAALAQLDARIKQFNALFPEVREGDSLAFAFDADGVTRVSLNGRALGRIPGRDFQRALLEIWIGEHPADDDLKAGMLRGGAAQN